MQTEVAAGPVNSLLSPLGLFVYITLSARLMQATMVFVQLAQYRDADIQVK